MNKGQLSYEYIVVFGMILFLAVPFFYSFFRYLSGGFDTQMNADMVTRVAHATEMLTNLGGVGSKFSVPVRISKITQNILQSNILSITAANGQTYSARTTSLNTKIGSEALVGDGFRTVPLIYTYLDTIVVGTQPQIVGACQPEVNPYSPQCSTSITVTPSQGFRLLGANFITDSEVILSKIQGQSGGCSTMTSCTMDATCATGQSCQNGICAEYSPPATVSDEGLILDVSTAQTGVGEYAVAVANPGGKKSECVSMDVSPEDDGGGGDA